MTDKLAALLDDHANRTAVQAQLPPADDVLRAARTRRRSRAWAAGVAALAVATVLGAAVTDGVSPYAPTDTVAGPANSAPTVPTEAAFRQALALVDPPSSAWTVSRLNADANGWGGQRQVLGGVDATTADRRVSILWTAIAPALDADAAQALTEFEPDSAPVELPGAGPDDRLLAYQFNDGNLVGVVAWDNAGQVVTILGSPDSAAAVGQTAARLSDLARILVP